MLTFKASSLPDVGSFHHGDGAALAWDILHLTAAHSVPDEVDLTDVPHLKPYAIACLCGLALLGQKFGKTVRLKMPTDSSCADHLTRLELPAWFASGPTPVVVKRTTNIALRHVTTPSTAVAEEIVDVLVDSRGLSPGVAPQMKVCLEEMIMNALTHAESPVDAVVVGQAFPATNKVDVAILDLGQTIRGHLTKNPKHASIQTDKDAILAATTDGVSGTPDGQLNRWKMANSGAGLFYTRDYCQSGGGELTVLSGNTWITFDSSNVPVIGRIQGSPFRGCLVNIRYIAQ